MADDVYQPAWRLHFLRDGKFDFLRHEVSQHIIEDVFATLKQTSVDSTKHVVDIPDLWKEYLRETALLVELDTPLRVIILKTKNFLATDIVIPISRDEHYLLKNRHSGEYKAVTKFSSTDRFKLICRAELMIEINQGNCEVLLEQNPGNITKKSSGTAEAAR